MAPVRESRPATSRTASTSQGVPTLQIMTRALMKTPVPMTLDRTMAAAGMSVRERTSPVLGAVSGSGTCAMYTRRLPASAAAAGCEETADAQERERAGAGGGGQGVVEGGADGDGEAAVKVDGDGVPGARRDELAG